MALRREKVKTLIYLCFIALTFLIFKSVVKDNQWNSGDSDKRWSSSAEYNFLTEVDVDKMTPLQMVDYIQWSNSSSCRLSHDFGGKLVRNPTGLDGQKAVCLEPGQLAPPMNNCLVYSFGINNEWSFDKAMADYGCEVYAFDPSMKTEDHDHTPSIHFFNQGLSNVTSTNVLGWNYKPLSSVYDNLKSRHGDRVIDYLKMDIENSEWQVIPQMIKSGMLDKIRQLAIEIHLYPFERASDMRKRVKIIRSVEDNGMIRFDSKLNPWSKIPFESLRDGIPRPFAYEIAWYNSKFLH